MNLLKKINFLNTLCNETLSITHYPGGWDIHGYDCSNDFAHPDKNLVPDLEDAISRMIIYILDKDVFSMV